jgi:hypothetical protein
MIFGVWIFDQNDLRATATSGPETGKTVVSEKQ